MIFIKKLTKLIHNEVVFREENQRSRAVYLEMDSQLMKIYLYVQQKMKI
jgi:hypothetical protein